MQVVIPQVLTAPGGAGSTPAGAAWIQRLPELVGRAVQRWQLHLGAPFGVGTASWTAPAHLPDGTPAVLKLSFPHDEARHEPDALAAWRGNAAVELLAYDAQDWALLLRRAHPGTPLLASTAAPAERIAASLGVLANLHRAPLPVVELPTLSATVAAWVGIATERATRFRPVLQPYADVVTRGLAQLSSFATAPHPDTVLLHGDLNPGNLILDDPGVAHWLAIDPKPMVGDPAYDLWPILSQIDDPFAYPEPLTVLMPRLLAASDYSGIAPDRIARWGLARTVESALWHLHTWPQPERQPKALQWLAREGRGWRNAVDALT